MVVENLWWYCASHGGGGGGGGGCRRGGGDFGIVVPVAGVDVVLMDPSACAHDMRFLPGIDFASAPGTTDLPLWHRGLEAAEKCLRRLA